MVHDPGTRLLVLNAQAGSMSESLVQRVGSALPGYRITEIGEWPDIALTLPPRSIVVACGGDGTVGRVAADLAGTSHVLGVIPTGTFNNFARALGIPLDVDDAIEIVRSGRPRPCTAGAVNGRVFLEATTVGRLAEAIELGESAKELRIAEAVDWALSGRSRRGFRFQIAGDVRLRGRATSIAIANTPTTGVLLPLAGTTPADPRLELRIVTPTTPLNLLRRFLRTVVRRRPLGHPHLVRHVSITTTPPVPAVADATLLGTTPLDVRALPGALLVLLPH